MRCRLGKTRQESSERERERVCVCVCVCEKEKEKETHERTRVRIERRTKIKSADAKNPESKDQTTFSCTLLFSKQLHSLKTSPHDPTSRPFRPRTSPRRAKGLRQSPRSRFLRRFAVLRGTATGRPKVFGASYVEGRWACGMKRVVGRWPAVGALG